jgi:16S rRNA (adenine1518-N6/adenine1519-N6)-dimethyltransferase
MILIPRKRFGQHFLRDQAIIQRIVSVLNITAQDHFVEIGPGLGALTIPVLKKLNHLEVIELDRNVIPELKKRAEGLGELTIYAEDALSFDLSQLKKDDRLLQLFGNLPYNISTPLLFHFLKYTAITAHITVMLQKEVAHRLTAAANTSDYGRLSVMMQYYCQTELLFNVAADAFYPPPKVASSIVRLTPYRLYPYQAKDERLFAEIVKQAFGQRRKTLHNSLKNRINDEIWNNTGISSRLRAENLHVKDFVAISNAISDANIVSQKNTG